MRDGEAEDGRDDGGRHRGTEDLPAGSRARPPLTRNSGGWRSGNGRLVTAGGLARKGLSPVQAMNRAIATYWQAAAAQT
jgi:hypothetical protein